MGSSFFGGIVRFSTSRYTDKLEVVEMFRRERIYPFRLGNVFVGGILNGKMLDNTVGRGFLPAACPRL